MDKLLQQIKGCDLCRQALPHEPRPVVMAGSDSKVIVIGQAPGSRVHATGIPWNDPSGDLLRIWLDVDKPRFYDTANFALMPMGFCYPGRGKNGDLPPRPECAPQWHSRVVAGIEKPQLFLLVGQYSQKYYLGGRAGRNLTETVRNFEAYLPAFLPLPHPSPRNRLWLKKNPWFDRELVPVLRRRVQAILSGRTGRPDRICPG